ncbi:MFS transporter [Streptomyces sp. NPDC002586]
MVCLGLFLLGLDLTVLNVALPSLEDDLRPGVTALHWIVDGYALVLGGTVLTTGALTDRIGRRRAFVTGLAVCGTASALGALAPAPWQVIASRCVLGAGAALLMPATLALICHLFPEPQLRRRAIAVWTAVGGVGGLAGPVVGGWLVEHFSWRAAFWLNLPIAVIAITLALWLVPEVRSTRCEPVDVPGALPACWPWSPPSSKAPNSAGAARRFSPDTVSPPSCCRPSSCTSTGAATPCCRSPCCATPASA